MVDAAQNAPDVAEVRAFKVKPIRLTPHLFQGAEGLGLRGVNAMTLLALVTLAANPT